MTTTARFESSLTRLSRMAIAAIGFLFLASAIGCRPGAQVAAEAASGNVACEEGLFAARAWECLRSGDAGAR